MNDRHASRVGDLYLMAIGVGVDPDDGVNHLCQHGHAAFVSFQGGADVGPAWVESPVAYL